MTDGTAAQTIDHLALLPAYLAAATAVAVLLADLFIGRRAVTGAAAVAGAAGVGLAALVALAHPARATFCGTPSGVPAGGGLPDGGLPDGGLAVGGLACSYVADSRAALVALLFAALTAGVLALSAPLLNSGAVPAGEYCFLLACSMTGGVVLGAAGDLITLVVAVETLTLPLYILVGLRRQRAASAESAVSFFVVSVVSTAVALLGVALLYAAYGAVHLDLLAGASGLAEPAGTVVGGSADGQARLARVGVVLLLTGLAFKVAAVPLHAWAPKTYDGAPLPVAAYLSTASKLGGVVAIVAVVTEGLTPQLAASGPVLAVLAVATMTVGNLVALRQRRMVRLLAWSSIAQAGYILVPLAAAAGVAGRGAEEQAVAVAAVFAYTVFFVLLELAAFAAVVALRPAAGDGGRIAAYAGAARRRPWVGAALTLALIGLAGLPPGLAGLFAKVAVVRSLLVGGAGWLALVVAANAVLGLVYYLRVSATLYARVPEPTPPSGRGVPAPGGAVAWPVVATLAVATVLAVLLGFAPQVVFDVVAG
ncbi:MULTISPECIES: proton-conducting transporter membrane subunit [unclassified Solwaraspora]|uniref:NADH-quinone oxidoreductase subunit N n=1 Tax=unclassified Solwaraspora TaxID=2627926 RepID=UPI00248B1914|nr:MULTISPECIES: proton-conducting transporter membrane subunit [unclassified Solwaraspora]WBC19714.1 proton-conducting transporter membrane subunit [Solwaraspora sp. WMMA2080]WJK32694.1 proton-conducting transporter membrane subunit [Solwaraspora sp. WMMA2065]